MAAKDAHVILQTAVTSYTTHTWQFEEEHNGYLGLAWGNSAFVDPLILKMYLVI